MPNIDATLSQLSEKVLKRPLDVDERLEIYEIADLLGMNNVQSFLYLLLVFKLHKETMRENLDGLEALSEKLDQALSATIGAAIRDIAADVAENMGKEISVEARKAFDGMQESLALRGHIVTVCFAGLLATLAYWLGATGGLKIPGNAGLLDVLLVLPAGWCFLFCALCYCIFWCADHWRLVKRSASYKAVLTLQILLILGLALYMLHILH